MITFIRGTIPKTVKFVQLLTCWEAHPGLCASDHSWCIQQVKACTKAAKAFLDMAELPSLYHCRVMGEGDYQMSCWFQLAHCRLAGPAFNMVAICELDDGTRNVVKSDWESGFVYMKAVSFFGQLWLAAERDMLCNQFVWQGRRSRQGTTGQPLTITAWLQIGSKRFLHTRCRCSHRLLSMPSAAAKFSCPVLR